MVAPAPGETRKPPLCRTALTWCLVGFMALGLSLGTRFFRPTIRGLQVSQDIVQQSHEYRRQIKANEALAAEVAFLRTERGTEWAVYEYIKKVRPGQQVGQVVEEQPPAAPPLSQAQRVTGWINRAETASADALRQAGRVVQCYVGLRPLDQPPDDRNEPQAGLSKAEAARKEAKSEPGAQAAPKVDHEHQDDAY